MNERARSALARFRELETLLADPKIATNVAKLRELGKERASLEELAGLAAEVERVEQAIAEGATMVRVGSAIFGSR